MGIPRCLTVAGSDSGGGAGIQADLKAFARMGCHGTSAIVAITAQNTLGVTAVHAVPVDVVRAQLDAVFDDIGADAVKTGMLFSAEIVETVADVLSRERPPLVVDPVMISTSGSRLLREDAVAALVHLLFPLATVVTPNLHEAEALAGGKAPRHELARRVHACGAKAVIVTGGHGDPVETLYDGETMLDIPVERHAVAATHGSGCTHSAILTALLARGVPLVAAAREASTIASQAVADGLVEIGAGDGPVDVLGLRAAR